MTRNMLRNGNFEADWSEDRSHRCVVIPRSGKPQQKEIGNVFTPSGWVTWFHHVPGKWDQPEVRDAWKSVDPWRVHGGEKAVLLFTFYRRHDGGFMQQVQVAPGTRLKLTAYAHAWSNHPIDSHEETHDQGRCSSGFPCGEAVFLFEGEAPDHNGDPWNDAQDNFTFYVGVDPTGGTNPLSDTVIWGRGAHIYNEHAEVPSVEVTAEAATVTVFLRSVTKWAFKHCDAYWDDVELVAVEEPEPPSPPPPPPPVETGTKLGAHVLKSAAGLREFLEAGARVAVEVGDFGPGFELGSNTLIIGASPGLGYDAQAQYNAGESPREAAQRIVNDMMPMMTANPHVKYWCGHNEPVWTLPAEMAWYAQFEIERMKLMADLELKCVIGNFSTGCPPMELWPAFVPAAEEGMRYEAILGLHEYSCPWMWWMTGQYQLDPSEDQGDEGWTTLRYRKAYRQFLIPAGAVIPLVITECGIDPLVNPKPPGTPSATWKGLGAFWRDNDGEQDKADYYFRQLCWYESELQKDDYVVGAAIFTWGNWGNPWDSYDVAGTPVADKLAAHAAANPAPVFNWSSYARFEPPEEEPPVIRGTPREQYERTYVLLPPETGAEWVHAVADGSWESNRFTVGGSADDAGIGDLDYRRVIAVNPHLWVGAMTLEAFFQEFYPGVLYVPLIAESPAELMVKLHSFYYERRHAVGVHAPPVLSPPAREQWDFWREEMAAMGVFTYKMLDSGSHENLELARLLQDDGVEVIVRLFKAQQFPGGLDEELLNRVRAFRAAGVTKFEIGNEPNLEHEYRSQYHGRVDWHDSELVAAVASPMMEDIRAVVQMGGQPAIYAMGPTDTGPFRPNPMYSSVEWLKAILGWVADNHCDEMARLLSDKKVWQAVHTSPFSHPFDFDPGPPPDDMRMLGYTVHTAIVRDLFDVEPLVISTEGGAFSPEHMEYLGWPSYSEEEWANRVVGMYDWLEANGGPVVCSWILSDVGVDPNQPWIDNGWYRGITPRPVVAAMKERWVHW